MSGSPSIGTSSSYQWLRHMSQVPSVRCHLPRPFRSTKPTHQTCPDIFSTEKCWVTQQSNGMPPWTCQRRSKVWVTQCALAPKAQWSWIWQLRRVCWGWLHQSKASLHNFPSRPFGQAALASAGCLDTQTLNWSSAKALSNGFSRARLFFGCKLKLIHIPTVFGNHLATFLAWIGRFYMIVLMLLICSFQVC